MKVRFGAGAFWTSIAVLIVVKLWLTSEIRVLPVYAPHDASNFIEHAKHILIGHWFGNYDDLTLIKGPGFPLYLALVQELGLPLPLAHQLLYATSSLIASLAVGPLLRSRTAKLVVFAVLLFNPFSYASLAWVAYRSQLFESLALLSVSCAVAILIRRKSPPRTLLPWMVGLGLFFTAFWLTREEAIWLVPALTIIIAAYLWECRADGWSEFRWRLGSLGLPISIWGGSVAGIMLINGAVYGWYTTVEMQSPEFVSAYNSLARIDVPTVYHVPVPREARRIAYRVSPAARELQPFLEGALGQRWASITCTSWNLCGDIGGGWFVWAFRDAVATAGHYSSGAAARSYYIQLAVELDGACSSGVIRCRAKAHTLMPPLESSFVPSVGADVLSGIRAFSQMSSFGLESWPPPPENELEDDYEFVARSIEKSGFGRVFNGWLVHGRLASVAVYGPSGVDSSAIIVFKPSPDVYAALSRDARKRGKELGVARFAITTTCVADCYFVVTDERKKETRVALAASTVDFQDANVTYHLDSISAGGSGLHDVDDGFKTRILAAIEKVYRVLLPWAMTTWLLLAALRVRRALARRSAFPGAQAILTIAVLASGLGLIVILALIDSLSFPAFNPEYLGALYPLVFFSVATTACAEASPIYRLFRRPLASRRRVVFAGLFVLALLSVAALVRVESSASRPPTVAVPPLHGGHPFPCSRSFVHGNDIVRGFVDSMTILGTSVEIGAATIVHRRNVIVVRGWAADFQADHPVKGVCVAIDGVPAIQAASYGATRPDVVTTLGREALADTGYEIRVSAAKLAPGPHSISVVGVDEAGRDEALAPSRMVLVR